MRKANKFNSITYCSGSTLSQPDLYLSINKSNYGINGIDKNNAIVYSSFVSTGGVYSTFGNLSNIFYLGGTSYVSLSKGNELVNKSHSGKCIYLNGNAQYVQVSDVVGSLDETHDLGLDDVMISFWLKKESDPLLHANICIKSGSSPDAYWLIYIESNINRSISFNASNYIPANSFLIQNINDTTSTKLWDKYDFILVRHGLGYIFKNGVYNYSIDISDKSAINYDNTGSFTIAEENAHRYNGNIKDFRIFKFGCNGLNTSGAYATNNLIIKMNGVDSYHQDVVYTQTTQVSFVSFLAKSIYQTLDKGYYNFFYNANRTMYSTGNGNYNFELGTTAGWSPYFTPSTFEASTTLPYSGTYSGHLITDAITEGVNCAFTGLTPGYYYELKVAIKFISGNADIYARNGSYYGDGDYFRTTRAADTSWTVYSYVFKTKQTHLDAINSLNFFIYDASSQGPFECYFEIVSLRRIGEVCHYKFNNNYLDSTSNGNTLTAYGTPTFPTCYVSNTNNFVHTNKQSGTISFWFRPLWQGEDSKTYYLYSDEYGAFYIRIEKRSTNYFYFFIEPSNDRHEVYKDTAFGTGMFNENTWNHVVIQWSYGFVDKIYYMRMFLNNNLCVVAPYSYTKIYNTESLSYINPIVGYSTSSHPSNSYFSNFISDSIYWTRTIAEARSIGLADWKSVEYHYNNGLGNKLVCDFNTKSMLIND